MTWIAGACVCVLGLWVWFYPNPYFRDKKGRLPYDPGYDGELIRAKGEAK